MKKLEVMLRSDHLEAVISFAIQQYALSTSNPLEAGDNENCIGPEYLGDNPSAQEHMDATDDVFCALEAMLLAVKAAKGQHHCDLMLLPLPTHYSPVVAYDPTDL